MDTELYICGIRVILSYTGSKFWEVRSGHMMSFAEMSKDILRPERTVSFHNALSVDGELYGLPFLQELNIYLKSTTAH